MKLMIPIAALLVIGCDDVQPGLTSKQQAQAHDIAADAVNDRTSDLESRLDDLESRVAELEQNRP